MTFSLDGFVANARKAAAADDPVAATCTTLARALDAAALAGPIDTPADETLLYEDDTISVWHERFRPDEELPPHDHGMVAVLGVYAGREANRLWRREGGWRAGGTLVLAPREFHLFGPDDVHSVQALDGQPSFGLHVYLGALTRVTRSLYDWDDGTAIAMSDAAFENLKRPR
ncbi:MAG: hypothetical protein AAF321_08830 [Pseudomonadota bacterium]